MSESYASSTTALLLVDPYNDFISEGGKLFPLAKAVIESTGTVKNMRAVVDAAREAGIRVIYVPHRRFRPSDLSMWKRPSPYTLAGFQRLIFQEGTWGGEWHPDFVPQPEDIMVKEHWNSSGFANTDLDIQLRQHGIEKLILVGLIANTCIETTGKFGVELGYHVTLVKDATAALSQEAMKVAHEINGPTYAHAILTSEAVIAAMATN